ncbi:MAG: HAD family hydrolase [Chloroflexota bacterium]
MTARELKTSASRRAAAQGVPLPSWNDGPAKQAILGFVASVTAEGGPGFVPAEDRVAVFDNDGTLWAEQPAYTQALFALDEVRRLAPAHPEWSGSEPWDSVLSGDPKRIAALSKDDLVTVFGVATTGMTVDEYAANVAAWVGAATHPVLKLPIAGTVYQPQLELLDYLEANGFATWIVSGGGVDFMRVFAEDAYGIPPERIIGSATAVEFRDIDGAPTLVKLPELGIYNDKEAKPVNIYQSIGKRPVLACGNSDGDRQMLEYTAAGDGSRLMILVHHDDAAREFAYDREGHVGRLDAAWDEAVARGWTVVSMKDDWATIFPG